MIQDDSFENDETLNVSGEAEGFEVGPAAVTIPFNDINVGFESGSFSASEDGPAELCVAILDPEAGSPVPESANFSMSAITVNGSAEEGRDYQSVNVSLGNFNSSSRRKCFSVTLMDDAAGEGDEVFGARLSLGSHVPGQVHVSEGSAAVVIGANDLKLGFDRPVYVVNESGGTVRPCVAMTDPPLNRTFNATFSLRANTVSNSAHEGEDYTPISNQNVGPFGGLDPQDYRGRHCFDVSISDDDIFEPAENFSLNLGPVPGQSSLIDSGLSRLTATVVINASDPPVYSISGPDAYREFNEGDTLVVRVSASARLTSGGDVLCTIVPASVNGTDSSDFGSVTAAASFNNSVLASACVFSVADDDSYEGIETFSVSLSDPANNSVPSATYESPRTFRVNASDIRVGFESETFSASEENASAEVCVGIADPNGTTVIPGSVNFSVLASTLNGSAEEGSDYQNFSMKRVGPFGNSDRRQCFNVTLTEDSAGEGDEVFGVEIAVADGAPAGQIRISRGRAAVVIGASDLMAGFERETYALDEDGGQFDVCVAVTSPSDSTPLNSTFSLEVSTHDVTAEGGSDYSRIESSLVGPFSDAQRRQCFSVQVSEDNVSEGSESFYLTLSDQEDQSPPVLIGSDRVNVTIRANDPPSYAVSVSPSSVSEGIGTALVNVSVSLSNGTDALDSDVNVTISVEGISVAPEDFTPVENFNVTVPAGSRVGSGNFSLQLADDNVLEGDETLRVSGSIDDFIAGLTPTIEPAVLTIADNDAAPSEIHLEVVPSGVSEDAGIVSVNVSAAFPDGSSVLLRDTRVAVSVSGVSADSGDFLPVEGFNITIPAGWSIGSGNFSLELTDDDVFEGDETLRVSGDAGADFSVVPTTLTIREDEVAHETIILSVVPLSFSEDAGTVLVNVSAAFPAGSFVLDDDAQVAVNVSGVSADSGDFLPVEGFNLTIPAGSRDASGNFSLELVDDSVSEGNETLEVEGSSEGFAIRSVVLTIVDDEAPPEEIILSVVPLSFSEDAGTVLVNVSAAFPAGSFVLDENADVAVSVSGVSADSGDFLPVEGFNLTIPAGNLTVSGNFSLELVDDSVSEGNETLEVEGYSEGFAIRSVVLTIVDDEAPPDQILLSAAPLSFSEDAGTVVVNVSAAFPAGSFALDENTEVSVSVSGGSSDFDNFLPVNGFVITIPAGRLNGSGRFSLTLVDDSSYEGDETLEMRGAAEGFRINSVILTIFEDDPRPSSGGGSGGGGGGGGGGSSGGGGFIGGSSGSGSGGGSFLPDPTFVPFAIKEMVKAVNFASPGTPFVVNLTGDGVTVMEVELYVDNLVNRGKLMVARLSSRTSSVPEDPEGLIYGFFGIDENRALDGSLRRAAVTFVVEKSFLSSNGFEAGDVTLLGYDERAEAWNPINVTFAGENETEVQFSFEKPLTYRIFAIVLPLAEADAPRIFGPDIVEDSDGAEVQDFADKFLSRIFAGTPDGRLPAWMMALGGTIAALAAALLISVLFIGACAYYKKRK